MEKRRLLSPSWNHAQAQNSSRVSSTTLPTAILHTIAQAVGAAVGDAEAHEVVRDARGSCPMVRLALVCKYAERTRR